MRFFILITTLLYLTNVYARSSFMCAVDSNRLPSASASASEQACPVFITKLINEDKENLFPTESYYGTCRKYIAHAKTFAQPKDLAIQFEKYQGKSLGPIVHSQIRACMTGDSELSAEIVSKFYYYFLRLEKNQKSDLEQISNIDLVLGNDPLKDLNCEHIKIASVRSRCEQIQSSCQTSITIDDLAQHTKKAKEEIAKLNPLYEHISDRYFHLDANEQVGEEGKELQNFKKLLDFKVVAIKESNPWMNAPTYQKAMKDHLAEKEAIVRQLEENQRQLYLNYHEGIRIEECFTNPFETPMSKPCGTDSMRSYFEATPRLPNAVDLKSGDSKDEAIAAGEYLDMQSCAESATTDKREIAGLKERMGINMAMTVLSAGLGYLYTAPKLLGTLSEAMVAEYAMFADQTINAGYFAQALVRATTDCNTRMYKIEEKDFSNNQCQVAKIYDSSQAIEEYNDCVSKIVWTGVEAMPYIRTLLHALVNDGKILKMAEENKRYAKIAKERIASGEKNSEIGDAMWAINDLADGGTARLGVIESVLKRKLSASEKDWAKRATQSHSILEKMRDRPTSIIDSEAKLILTLKLL